eukprot:7822711-Ditylum_brightwellii.AAC.1
MDNVMLFCVYTVHTVGGMVERVRKRPRVIELNKKHVYTVWGDNGKREINMPKLIDGCNHWKGGVDVSEQRIAYYHPNFYSHCNRVSIFLQILSIMYNYTYVVHKDHYGSKALSHKMFTVVWVKLLMQRAHLSFFEQIESESYVSFTRSSTTTKHTKNTVASHISMTSFPPSQKGKRTQTTAQKVNEAEESQICLYLLV